MHILLSLELNKQTAESKQTADLAKNHNFSFLTTLYCISKAISATIHKSSPEEEEEEEHQLPSIDSLLVISEIILILSQNPMKNSRRIQ